MNTIESKRIITKKELEDGAFEVIKFEDKDKEEKGGYFLNAMNSVPLVLKSPGTSSGSYKGTYFAQDVEVVMILKEEGLDPDDGFIGLTSFE